MLRTGPWETGGTRGQLGDRYSAEGPEGVFDEGDGQSSDVECGRRDDWRF